MIAAITRAIRRRRSRKPTYAPAREREYDLQVAVAQWLDMHGFVWFHVPNEGKRAIATAMRLKKAGLKAGVPDVIICGRGTTLCIMAIELKTRHGIISTVQRAFLAALHACGWPCAVRRDIESVCDFVRKEYEKQTGMRLEG